MIGLMMLAAAVASPHLDIGVGASGEKGCLVELQGQTYEYRPRKARCNPR